MKGLRFLLFGLVICLASGVKAQFYDSADDIYYYVEYKDGGYGNHCFIFNFDGNKACVLNIDDNNDDQRYPLSVEGVKNKISRNTNYLEDRIETSNYDTKYVSNSTYQRSGNYSYNDQFLGHRYGPFTWTFKFSYDRETLDYTLWEQNQGGYSFTEQYTYRRVDKSYFKVGRSRTPSGTMHE